MEQTAIGWFFSNLIAAPVNVAQALIQPGLWLDWLSWDNTTEDKQSLMRFIYYGASVELFFVFLFVFLVLTIIGILNNRFMWGMVRGFEWIGNTVGRIAAWAGLLMVLQQILIVFLQRVFAVAEIGIGFGATFTKDVSWWAEALKFENALVVSLCVSYTFIQGSHVRVDLVYSAVGYRVKKVIDMVGSLIFMMPAAILIWLYAWFFMWRHLIVPKPAAANTYTQLVEQKYRALRWNVETVGFSPNGFNVYWLFKLLLVTFCALVLLQAMAFFYRCYLEFVEGEESEGKYLDKDKLGDEQAELAAEIH